MINYFWIQRWTPADMPYLLYKETELWSIHPNFGHPSRKSTEHVLKKVTGDRLPPHTRRTIESIAQEGKVCATHARGPKRFRLTIRADGLAFNHTVQLDTMFSDSKSRSLHRGPRHTLLCGGESQLPVDSGNMEEHLHHVEPGINWPPELPRRGPGVGLQQSRNAS